MNLISFQFLNSTVEPFFAKHNCRELLFVELMGRVLKEPASLYRFSTNLIDEAAQNIYGAFSSSTSGGTIVEVQKYNAVARKWESFKTATFKTPMQEYGLAIVGDKIFAMGGQIQAKEPFGWAEISLSNKVSIAKTIYHDYLKCMYVGIVCRRGPMI